MELQKSTRQNLKVVDVISIVDPAHVLHQEVQLTAIFSSHVDS